MKNYNLNKIYKIELFCAICLHKTWNKGSSWVRAHQKCVIFAFIDILVSSASATVVAQGEVAQRHCPEEQGGCGAQLLLGLAWLAQTDRGDYREVVRCRALIALQDAAGEHYQRTRAKHVVKALAQDYLQDKTNTDR
jgi:hypothetical protein